MKQYVVRGNVKLTTHAPFSAKEVKIGSPESAVMFENIMRAMRITPELNKHSFDDQSEIRKLFSELIGREVDGSFSMIPPFYTDHGVNIRIGRNVFINQGCTIFDIGGFDIEDDALIGPKVNIITSNHPLSPSSRRESIIARPITIKRNVWIAAAATILPGVTIGENSVVAAGAVVAHDVPPNSLAAGVPAKVIRSIEE